MVVVRIAVAVDEVLPADQVHALEVLMVKGDTGIDDARGDARSRHGFWDRVDQLVVGRMALKRHLTRTKKNGAVAEDHGGEVAGSENESNAKRDAHDEFDRPDITGFVVKFGLIGRWC